MKQWGLREARSRKGWTQAELEDRSGVPQSVISKLERGESSNPTFDTIARLETALGLRRGALHFGESAIAS